MSSCSRLANSAGGGGRRFAVESAIQRPKSAHLLAMLLAVLLVGGFGRHVSAQPPPGGERKVVREIFVPFEDLNQLLEDSDQRVYLTRQEYEELLAKAQIIRPEDQAPQSRVILSADYDATIGGDRATIQASIVLEVLTDELVGIPLSISGVSLRTATLDGKPASMGRGTNGRPVLFVRQRGRHELKLEMIAPVETAAAQQTMKLELVTTASSHWRLTVPGNIEIKSGAAVISRTVDESESSTRFELLPARGTVSLVMSLNNRTLLQERVVLARSVFLSELTGSYERLHATVSLAIPHGAVDSFQFQLPPGFEVREVATPMLSRWAVEDSSDGARLLQVMLREATTETIVLTVLAERAITASGDWTMPALQPRDVSNHVAVVGVLGDERLIAESLSPAGLIPIDVAALQAALPASVSRDEPGATRLRPLAAFYAPQAEFRLAGVFRIAQPRFEVTANLLFILNEKSQELRAGFALLPVAERLFAVDIVIPEGWQITDVTKDDGSRLPFELFAGDAPDHRLQVKLSPGAPPGDFFNVFVTARRTPAGWLDNWSQIPATFPPMMVPGAARDRGALAVQMHDDLLIRPEQLTNVTPLAEKEKGEFGWGETATSLAYRYESQPFAATFHVERGVSRLTARVLNFLRLESDGLWAHYELLYAVDQARADQLSFSLPESTPATISIRGLDVPVKEFRSETVDGRRRWTAELAEPRTGMIRLAVDFQQPMSSETVEAYPLPLASAENVAYQSGTIAVEGHAEFDVRVATDARNVDVGELVDADYQVGKRLLGAFGYVGDPVPVSVDVARRPEFGLPQALVQRAELVTLVSDQGRIQTAARYQLRTKALFLELLLPDGASLWSVTVDGQPASPQREADHLLVSLPPVGPNALRDVQVVFEMERTPLRAIGTLQALAPRLALRDAADTSRQEVPMADLQWHLVLPRSRQLIFSGGTVYRDEVTTPALPLRNVARALVELGSAVAPRAGALRRARFDSQVAETAEGMTYSVPEPAAADDSGPFGRGMMMGGEVVDATKAAPEEAPLAQADAPALPPTAMPTAQVPPPGPPATPAPPAQQAAAPPEGAPPVPTESDGEKYWALQGLRSLPIELVDKGEKTTFRSLGDEPRILATVANQSQLRFMSLVLALIVAVAGLAKSSESAWAQMCFVAYSSVVLLAAPVVIGLVTGLELDFVFHAAFYVACALIPWYLLCVIARGLTQGTKRLWSRVRRRPATVAACLVFCVALSCRSALAQSAMLPEENRPVDSDWNHLLELLRPAPPVKIPADAVVLPYPSDDPAGFRSATKVLVPYAEYVRLWNLVNPDQRLTTRKLPASYALGGATYVSTLTDGEFLSVAGEMEIELFSDNPTTIPMPLRGGAVTEMTVDGEPARVQVLQPQQQDADRQTNNPPAQSQAGAAVQAASSEIIYLQLSGQGRKRLKISLRFPLTRVGGWRQVEGQLPTAPATGWNLVVPAAQTEVKWTMGEVVAPNRQPTDASQSASPTQETIRASAETKTDNETVETALSADGGFQLQWRPKIAESQVDQSLTARSVAVLDIQEDGVRLSWQVTLEFGRGTRDAFQFAVPGSYVVERVAGTNVRGWKVTEGDNQQLVDVSLLRPVAGEETVLLFLARRGTVGAGALASLDAPAVAVPDAALHQGTYTVRRSPLLDVRVENASGLSRAEGGDTQTQQVLAEIHEESPLGIRPFQVYRFVATPLKLRLSAAAYDTRTVVDVQTVWKIGERDSSYEARLLGSVANRPRYSLRCQLPAGLQLNRVDGPPGLEWTVLPEEEGEVLQLFFPQGQRDFSLLLRGQFGARSGETLPVPLLRVLDVDEQRGSLVAQADPAYDLRAENLQGCESVPLERVFTWLRPEQRELARVALVYANVPYQAILRIVPRQPRVNVLTVSNVRVTPLALEETVYLQFAIRDAGIREVVFQLPQRMRDARFTVPLLRQKTMEDVAGAPDRIRVRLELQDDVTQQLIVLVEHDRPLTTAVHDAPIPVVETGRTDQRYVVLESAGRDEVVVSAASQLVELSRQQSEWGKLTALLGDKITQAYLVRLPEEAPGAAATAPQLAFQTRQRQAVATAGARIGLAKTLLVVDGHGAYRGVQQYQVDNKTEQYLEVELPFSAELWTVQVAGEAMKPTTVPGANTNSLVRIPLIKTAAGDLDYLVELKYGGRIRFGTAWDRVRFPFIHTRNIHVEQSQVRLRLPATHRWLDFGGTMTKVGDESELIAGFLSYQSKQIEQLLEVAQTDSNFSKVRASNNLKQLGLALHTFHDTYRGVRQGQNLQREFANNSRLLQQAESVANAPTQELEERQLGDNRSALLGRYRDQSTERSKNVVTQLQGNFDEAAGVQPTQPPANSQTDGVTTFNLEWFKGNRLQVTELEKANKKPEALQSTLSITNSATDSKAKAAATELGRKLAEDARENVDQKDEMSIEMESRASGRAVRGELEEQIGRYQQRLEQKQLFDAQQQPSGLGLPPASAGQMGGFGGGVANLQQLPQDSQFDADRAGALPSSPGAPADLAGMRSLEIELPERGVEYLFLTPRGEIEVHAWALASPIYRRLLQLALILIVTATAIASVRIGRRLIYSATRLG